MKRDNTPFNDTTLLKKLSSIDTKEVDLTVAVSEINKWSGSLLDYTCKKYNYSENDFIQNYDSISNVSIFLTGFTGDMGSMFTKSLLESHKNNRIYCLCRSGENRTAFERFSFKCDKLAINRKYINRELFCIEGNYREYNLGISESDWNFLSKNIDIIFNVGCRTSLNMSWKQGINGILKTSNTLLKLSLNYRIKPIVVISSAAGRLGLLQKPGHGLNRGYGLTKYCDVQRFTYLYGKCFFPVRIIIAGYICRHILGSFRYFDALELYFWFMFKTRVIPDYTTGIDYLDSETAFDDIIKNLSIKNDGIIEQGMYSSNRGIRYPDWHQFVINNFPEMKFKRIPREEWRECLLEFININKNNPKMELTCIGIKMLYDITECYQYDSNIIYRLLPANNPKLKSVDNKKMLKLLTWLKNQPTMDGDLDDDKYGWKWYEEENTHTPKSKL